jgi:hypothetical protein
MNEDRIEEELRRALRREEPPAGFAERVLARVRAEDDARPGLWQSLFGFMRIPKFRAALAAAVVLVMVAGTWEYRRYEREREAGEAARRQLMMALRITGSKLQYAQQKVNQSGSRQFGPVTDSEDSQ